MPPDPRPVQPSTVLARSRACPRESGGRCAPAPPVPPHSRRHPSVPLRAALCRTRSGHPVIAGARACSIDASVVMNRSSTHEAAAAVCRTGRLSRADLGLRCRRHRGHDLARQVQLDPRKHSCRGCEACVRGGADRSGNRPALDLAVPRAEGTAATRSSASTRVMQRPRCRFRSTRLTQTTPTASRRSCVSAASPRPPPALAPPLSAVTPSAKLRLKALGWGVRRIASELGCSHMDGAPVSGGQRLLLRRG